MYEKCQTVEEDGDEVFIPIERGCLRWECQTWKPRATKPIHPQLIIVDGFYECPTCGYSYGPIKGNENL